MVALPATSIEPFGRPSGFRPTAIDLFSGAGGLTAGLSTAGFNVLAAVEIDPLAADTYASNFPGVTMIREDVRCLRPRRVASELGLGVGDLDLLVACPPCQGFSTVRTLNGARRLDDHRNNLLLDAGRFVLALRPRAFVIENVPGLASEPSMSSFAKAVTGLGYRLKVEVVDAWHYGVPQRRERLLAVGVRGASPPQIKRVPIRLTVRDAIQGLPMAGSSGDPLHDHGERRSPRIMRLISQIPADGGSRSALAKSDWLDCHRRCDGFKDVYGRMRWDAPAGTLTGGCVNPSKGRFLHPEFDRAITLREAALLQSFPPSYSFSLARGKYAAAVLIGNAVPPELAHRQGLALREVVG